MMPCRPPMMFVSIVGHAIRQTAGVSGPSTMDRSYLRLGRVGAGATAVGLSAAVVAAADAVEGG